VKAGFFLFFYQASRESRTSTEGRLQKGPRKELYISNQQQQRGIPRRFLKGQSKNRRGG